MPGENITFTKYDEVSAATIYYYVESLAGSTGVYEHGGKYFDLYKQVKYTRSGYLTYAEEFHDITGFTQWWSDPKFSSFDQNGTTSGVNAENYLCYTRNSYNLKFFNHNDFVTDREKSVQFEAPLSGYNFVPSYPKGLEANAYEFAGWYTTAGCYDGSEVNWDSATMPAGDLTLYAKWTPKTHRVRTFLTEANMTAATPVINEWPTVAHGSVIDPKPADPTNGTLNFVAWFYRDENGQEHAFDFAMPVTRDMDLYAKWSAKSLVGYEVRYVWKDEQGNETEIADRTTGRALAETDKTFEAKVGTQLYEDYQEGYFPVARSDSLHLSLDEKKNVLTLYYRAVDKVPYTVRYLEVGTEKVLHEEKYVPDNRRSGVVETFEPVSGYMPDAYQKSLILSPGEPDSNVITFWYEKDTAHAYYIVTHYTQNVSGTGYSKYQEEAAQIGDVNSTVQGNPISIPGFTYVSAKSEILVKGKVMETGTNSATLTVEGLEIRLYYDRESYPYTVRYLEAGTNVSLLEDKVVEGQLFGTRVEESYAKIDGYVVDQEKKSITIGQSGNVIIFYYTEQEVTINYVVEPKSTKMGSLDNEKDEAVKVITGTVQGSTPAPASANYKFEGWYLDEACTRKVPATWVDSNNKLTPQKNAEGLYEAATYYAKFELNVFDLTITKSGTAAIDENQSFIFEVTGPNGYTNTVTIQGDDSVTIRGLTVGEYTVTEKTSWSWRYQPDGPQIVKVAEIQDGAASVTVKNTRTLGQWLNGCSYAINRWINNVVLKSH